MAVFDFKWEKNTTLATLQTEIYKTKYCTNIYITKIDNLQLLISPAKATRQHHSIL